MLITAMERGKGSRWNLYVEGEFALSLDAETLAASGLKAGQELNRDALEKLRRRDGLRRARERALYLLGARSHTRHELTQKLRKTVEEDIAEETAARMEELGLINDEDFASRYAGELSRVKGWGAARIRQKLLEKGIDRELADQALDELAQTVDVQEQLTALLRRRYARYLSDQKGVEKTIAALSRLGYRYGEIREALTAVAAEDQEE